MEWGVCIIKCMPPNFVYSRCNFVFFLIEGIDIELF